MVPYVFETTAELLFDVTDTMVISPKVELPTEYEGLLKS